MTQENKASLTKIFSLQEKTISRHIQDYPARFSFVSNCIELLLGFGFSDEALYTMSDNVYTVFVYFFRDSLSTLINAIRLCLQGCETDAFALMRIVIENLTIFDYIIIRDLFKEALAEIKERAPKGKKYSGHFNFETARKHLKTMSEDRRAKLHGQFSTIGAHSSPPRLSMSRFKLAEKDVFKLGLLLDNPRIDQTLGELAALSLYFVIVIDYFRSRYDIDNIFHLGRLRLEQEYDILANVKSE